MCTRRLDALNIGNLRRDFLASSISYTNFTTMDINESRGIQIMVNVKCTPLHLHSSKCIHPSNRERLRSRQRRTNQLIEHSSTGRTHSGHTRCIILQASTYIPNNPRIIHQITDWALDRIHSYSTAITNMVTRDMALSRSLDRLAALEDELKTYMASLEHESQLIAQ